ncbi:MAG: hypothetical protein ACW98Y_02540 [Candidatus Thorarchaeota archaeon]
MARTSRELPKELAEFGQRQFNDSGAQAVEVLRVKAAVIRKYWAKLRGIAYLVAVVNLDRVRVYFFSSAGAMLVGENVDHDIYKKIRSKSKLVKKYEKPTPPTELELRMEATEELRSHLSKAIRRVARFLGVTEPAFPTIFVSKQDLDSIDQAFAMSVEDDGAYLFEESSINSRIFEGLAIRSAFLSLLDSDKSQDPIAHCVGNVMASMLLKGSSKDSWNERLIECNKTSELQQVSYHLLRHLDSYSSDGFSKILNLIKAAPVKAPPTQWIAALSTIHSQHEVSLGTDAWHTIDGFCQSLKKPRKLSTKRHTLESIHLAPRLLCNTEPLGFSLGIETSKSTTMISSEWMRVVYRSHDETITFRVDENLANRINSIHYSLKLSDVIPKSGGIQSKGKQILHWAAKTFGISEFKEEGFETSIVCGNKSISESEKAVLERLSLGHLEILSNTLIGSPQRIDSLVKSGCITLLPDFSHIGIVPNFLLEGPFESIVSLSKESSIESTIFETETTSFGVFSSPSIWGKHLLETVSDSIKIHPIIQSSSERRMIRDESPFSEIPVQIWSS